MFLQGGPLDSQKLPDDNRSEQAHLGKSLVIKGEVSGSEDLYLDGQVEGAIDLKGHRLTIGPNGRVKANLSARSAVIHGKLEGNINATDRVDLKQSAIVTGDIVTQRISIDEGAFFKGGVDISRGASAHSATEIKSEAKSTPGAAGQGASPAGIGTRPASAAALDPRK
jgi:cytoskeletal protein CcmA (bactofilin family)